MSIRAKILVGCLALTMLTVALGLFAQQSERRLGRLGFDIYDRAFMAVSYLRAAQVEFANLAAHPGTRPSDAAAADLLSDLEVAHDRAMSQRGRAAVVTLERETAASLTRLAADPALARPVQAAFERAVEVFADDGFLYRRDVGKLVKTQIHRTTAAILISLIAALAITALIGRLIAPPVRRAVSVAQAIAAGKLDNPIHPRGRGETGDLLRALATMQASIAAAMDRIRTLMEHQAERHADEMESQHAQMEAALQNMSQGLCLFDAEGRLKVANRRFAAMFGAPAQNASAREVLTGAGLSVLLEACSDGPIEALTFDLADGRTIAVSQHAVSGGGWVATYEDVSERREAELRLSHMARHDILTGLPNRLLFGEHMRELLARCPVRGSVAVLCLDLDRFKLVNDTLGHPAGDSLLRAVASRLTACVRGDDIVVRLGGDEFAVILQGISQPAEAGSFAKRVVAALQEPFDLGGQRASVGASIGIALSGPSMITPDALLKAADLALYRAKADGRGTFHFFEEEMDRLMQARRALEEDLREAVAARAFDVHYQPLVSSGGAVSGFEALLRWTHPRRGPVSPAVFIPVAEEIGLIAEIGSWVMRRACADCVSWPGTPKVAVNLSPAQFHDSGLADEVAEALAAAGLPASRLEVEITESTLLQDDQRVLATLHALRGLGVRIAMDDFGTGYSSLGYLRRFPFDKIKIDQSFVRGLGVDRDCLAIIRAVIGLGRSLGMSVNAEGVELEEQRERLVAEGCDELQGFLFSRPRPNASVGDMLLALRAAPPARESVEAG